MDTVFCGSDNPLGEQPIDTYAHNLVRLALSAERSRGSFKRDDINKKGTSFVRWWLIIGTGTYLLTLLAALSGNGRVFSSVFARAQEILRKTFGMEIHELMTRVERDKALAPENNTVNATSGRTAKGVLGLGPLGFSSSYKLLCLFHSDLLVEDLYITQCVTLRPHRSNGVAQFGDSRIRHPRPK